MVYSPATIKNVATSKLSWDWVLPCEPRPIRLMNTVWAERQHLHDDLQSSEDLAAWLRSADLEVVKAPTKSELVQTKQLRTAIRRITEFVTNDQRPSQSPEFHLETAIRLVNELSSQRNAAPFLELVGSNLASGKGAQPRLFEEVLSCIAQESIELLAGKDRVYLRACNGPGCVLFFVRDHPRRSWCGDACGNRARAARHYRKQKSEGF